MQQKAALAAFFFDHFLQRDLSFIRGLSGGSFAPMIHLPTVLETIKKFEAEGNPPLFDLEVVSSDEKRKTAGGILRFSQVRICHLQAKSSSPKPSEQHLEKLDRSKSRDPRHRVHGTLNLEDPRTGEINKVHIRLITRFNGQKVIY